MISDTWCEDSSIALTYLHLAATDLGIGSCWVQIHMRKKDGLYAESVVRDIVKIDEHYRIAGILALGHSDDIPEPHALEDIDKTKIHPAKDVDEAVEIARKLTGKQHLSTYIMPYGANTCVNVKG